MEQVQELAKTGNYKEAIELCKKLQASDKKNSSRYLREKIISLIHLGRYSKAGKQIKKHGLALGYENAYCMLRLGRKVDFSLESCEMKYIKGEVLLKEQNYTSAKEIYQGEHDTTNFDAMQALEMISGCDSVVMNEKTSSNMSARCNSTLIAICLRMYDTAERLLNEECTDEREMHIRNAYFGFLLHCKEDFCSSIQNYTCFIEYFENRLHDENEFFHSLFDIVKIKRAILTKTTKLSDFNFRKIFPKINSIAILHEIIHHNRRNRRFCKEIIEKYHSECTETEEQPKDLILLSSVVCGNINDVNLDSVSLMALKKSSLDKIQAEYLKENEFDLHNLVYISKALVIEGKSPMEFIEKCLSLCKDRTIIEKVRSQFIDLPVEIKFSPGSISFEDALARGKKKILKLS